jgi:repressor LexA
LGTLLLFLYFTANICLQSRAESDKVISDFFGEVWMTKENWPKRFEILRYLARRAARGEGSPSVREVGGAVGFRSVQPAHKHLRKLEEAGYVEMEGVRSRGIRLTEKGWEAAGRAQLLGRVAAGRGIEAIEVRDEAFPLAAELLVVRSGKGRFWLEARGDSMTGARIEEGDLLLVEENEDPPNGTVVVALLHGEKVTVKRIYREGTQVRLRPHNGEHRDIVVPAEEVNIQGEVIYVLHPPSR